MSLRRFEISLDEERITKDGVYTSEELYYTLDSAMERKKIIKTGKGIYEGDDTHAFGSMYFSLYGCKWFMKYVDKWLSYHDGAVEDVVESVKIKERQAANEFE